MKYNDEFARCLAEIDVPGIRRLWKFVSPHLPQPTSDREALLAIHHARTQTRSFSLRLRAYSHAWLLDNGYPSGLPDELKPKAERMYPRIQEGVGIACKGEGAPIIQKAMSDAVLDIYADEISPDPVKVKKRIMEVRKSVRRKLFGS